MTWVDIMVKWGLGEGRTATIDSDEYAAKMAEIDSRLNELEEVRRVIQDDYPEHQSP